MANKKRVFISYDYENDRHYKNLLLAWDANKQFEFYISDYSADVSINSSVASAIKSTLSRYINQGTVFLIIVGKKTANSSWIKWEIEKAVELRKKIVAVKTDRDNTTPPALYGVGANWALSFTHDAITKALDNA
jgi:hypothetical protein